MDKRFIELIRDRGINCLAIIGMAKNSGKTVAFNTLVKEGTHAGLKLALISFGRDGEEIDSLTLKKKPRIKVSAGNVFATADRVYQASNLKAGVFSATDILTPFGEVKVYKAEESGIVELIGINSIGQLQKIKEYLPEDIDLILLDGALDRRSSAVPLLAEGIILSTGAVIANTVEGVIEKTLDQVRKLTTPEIKGAKLRKLIKGVYHKDKNAMIDSRGDLVEIESRISFSLKGLKKRLELSGNDGLKTLILKGALVNSFVKDLIYDLKIKNCKIVVKDGTRVFLDRGIFNLLDKYNIELAVLDKINMLGITVNPLSPYGVHLDSRQLVDEIREKLPGIPVYDLMSEEYLSLK